MNRRDRWLSHWILDDKGVPIPVDLETWAKWFEKRDRIVKQEWIGDCFVSTVFLGIDHNFGETGPPILWETMVFSNRSIDQEWMQRCAGSKEQAEAMHEAMAMRVCEIEKLDYIELRKPKDEQNTNTTKQ